MECPGSWRLALAWLQGVSGVSMDLRDTGLSASDQSGDLEQVLEEADLAETAEWE